ncbi:hypothetical protein POV27_17200 [Aureisphaera galaxeae]|uniref:hypothetical protein n=1 Tax=Aureisphaera galaxeae TaxID=1538023 RepID=UPI0023500985|nr:hypothetical protein [Aureisphaera galaxeae]MDC8005793.1 hypothetical protein [Aureisphaera galaxeae]
MQVKKFIVLGILFVLPITVYLFFATGKNNFVKLPTLTYGVHELSDFKSLDGKPLQLKDRITVLMFFGNDVEGKKANAFNLAHKIYKKNYQFSEFQFVALISEDQKEAALQVKEKLTEIENPKNWRFAIGTEADMQKVFASLKSNSVLTPSLQTNTVFIIDKERNLRGRTDDEDYGIMYGFNASDYAEINNKMDDDIKIVLAEYRLALKKYKADRKDEFRDTHLK